MVTICLVFTVAGGTSIMDIVHGCYGDKVWGAGAGGGGWQGGGMGLCVCACAYRRSARPGARGRERGVGWGGRGTGHRAALWLGRLALPAGAAAALLHAWVPAPPGLSMPRCAAFEALPAAHRPLPRRLQGSACENHAYSTWPWTVTFGGAMMLLSQVRSDLISPDDASRGHLTAWRPPPPPRSLGRGGITSASFCQPCCMGAA